MDSWLTPHAGLRHCMVPWLTHTPTHNTHTPRLFQIDARPDRVSLRFCSGLVLARTDSEQFCNTSLSMRARPDLESLVEVSAAPARHVCMYMQHLGQSMFEMGRRQCWGPRCSQELARTCTQIPACPAPPEGGAAEHIHVYIHTYIYIPCYLWITIPRTVSQYRSECVLQRTISRTFL